jgi:outer membrane protein assembly factor BamB
LIADGKIFVGDEDGDIAIFKLSKRRKLLAEISMDDSAAGTPVAAGDALYITTRHKLYAIDASMADD